MEIWQNQRRFHLRPSAAKAWSAMLCKARADRITLKLVSAFRSIQRQQEIVDRKRTRGFNDDEIFRTNARPGFSEHHTGSTVDISTPGTEPLEEAFENSAAFQWLTDNAAAFGFYLSYPRDNVFGIIYEPWHWCWHETPPQSDSRRGLPRQSNPSHNA